MATKTTRQYDPDHLQAEADKIEREYRAAREAAQKARAAVDTARENALTEFWQNRITEFYNQVRPQVAKAWEDFEDTVTGSTEQDTLTAWRVYAMARARAQGEHEVLRREAQRQGLRGVRPMVSLPQGGYAESVTQVLTRFEDGYLQATAAQLLTTAETVGEAAEERARSNGEVFNEPKIVARFKVVSPLANSGAYAMKLTNPGDGREVYFRDGLYYARDEETAQLIRAHAKKKSIREINEHGEVINTFGDTFVPRP